LPKFPQAHATHAGEAKFKRCESDPVGKMTKTNAKTNTSQPKKICHRRKFQIGCQSLRVANDGRRGLHKDEKEEKREQINHPIPHGCEGNITPKKKSK
jgi:hypothetical protein